MIALQARILGGLDEFMLRLGHLSALCALASERRGSWARIERELGSAITETVPVSPALKPPLASYLRIKRLCPIQGSGAAAEPGDTPEYRYPYLTVISEGEHDRLEVEPGERTEVWWQDLCLADPEVRSRVGAVTVSKGKSGSKTGVSHITDWAQILDLVANSGALSAEGQLIANLGGFRIDEHWARNPYVLGTERLVYAYMQLSSDMDVFSRFVPRLLGESIPIRKQTGTQIFVRTMSELVDEAEGARYLSSQQIYRMSQHLRDLEPAGKRGGVEKAIGSPSTAWHRAASRLETYVDLGLLEKGRAGANELYEYVYYPTSALQRATDALSSSEHNGLTWLDEHLAFILFEGNLYIDRLESETLLPLIPNVVAALNRPASVLPLGAMALGIVWLLRDRGIDCSIAVARQSLESLAREQPDLARLSRGGAGERAEFISFTPKGLGR